MEKKIKKNGNFATFLRILSYLTKHKFRLFLILVGIVGSTIATTSTSLFIKVLIDKYIEPMLKTYSNDFTPLLYAILKLLFILVVGIVCSLMWHLLMVKLSNIILLEIREQMYKKMQYFPIKYFDQNKAGDIMSKYTNDLDTFREVISQSIPQTTAGLFSFTLIFISMLSLSINLFAVVVLMCATMIIFTKFIGNKSLISYRKTQKGVGDLNTYVEEMVQGAKEVKVYCYEERNIEKFREKNKLWGDAVRKADTLTNILMPCMNSIGNIAYVLVAFLGGMMAYINMKNFSLIGVNILTIGTITSFMNLTKSFTHLIAELSSQVPFIMQSLSGAERIFNLIDTNTEIDEGHIILNKNDNGISEWVDNDKKVKQVGKVVMKDVCFSYEENKPILKNINIYANEGEKIALVGATGAGKTTITNLINRFYEINDGIITYDGIDIRDIKKKDLRSSLAIVLQDVHMWTGTILDNIRYGNLSATDEECINAAKLVHADEFIENLPNAYDTVINADTGLSQGQKQLISIARAAVANPLFLILDEATSSIDTRTEKLVQKGIESITKGRTVFIIAHRLSTIREADVIMVMEHGEIIERGDHTSLLAKKGHYYELYTGKVELD